MKRIFSGAQPTGYLHLGNYLGALRQWAELQSSMDALFCIVNLHALTIPHKPTELRQHTRQLAAAFLASGIDPERSTIFVQSDVTAHSELAWLLACHTPLGWLNRMTQFKEKAGSKREQAALGLYAYPVLMAADILAYKATHVPVGDDQKQHLELGRDIAQSFNTRYDTEFFPLPEPVILKDVPRVMSLRDGTKKMSKSDPSDLARINLSDDATTIALKVRKAKTDPQPIPENPQELEGRPEASNLLRIFAALSHESLEATLARFAGASFSTFKPELAELLVETVTPIGIRLRELEAASDHIETVLSRGQQRAQELGSRHMAEIHQLLGL